MNGKGGGIMRNAYFLLVLAALLLATALVRQSESKPPTRGISLDLSPGKAFVLHLELHF
jgi:hypothetical protein